MKYFISLISALLFTFTVFAQGVLEIKQSRQTLKNLLADDQPMTVVYTAQNTGTSTGHHYPASLPDQFTESRLAQKSASPR